MSAAELDEPLPEGVFHLLAADDDLAPYRDLVAVCGEVVSASALPLSCYPPPEDEPDGEPGRELPQFDCGAAGCEREIVYCPGAFARPPAAGTSMYTPFGPMGVTRGPNILTVA